MSTLSTTQKTLLSLYKKFKNFCDNNHLRYYAVAGTAIGAVRHHGFIPWDDDIDIGMPIQDFEKFKKIITKSCPKGTGFRESYWMGGKLYDINTTVIDIRAINRPDAYHGIYIDIFPLIGLPEQESDRQNFINDIKSFSANAELLELYPEISPFSKKDILQWKKYLLHTYDYETSSQIAGFCFFLLDGEGLRHPIVTPFEDTQINISSNYDWDLSNHFGDYMTLPPIDQRKTHDGYHFVDPATPFIRYAKEYCQLKPWLHELLDKNQIIEGRLTQYSNSLAYELNQKNAAAEEPPLPTTDTEHISVLQKIKQRIHHGQ